MSHTHIAAQKSPNTRLQRARKLNGWSQEYVAEKIGTTAKNVSRWERGDNKPVPYYREKLTQLFGKNAEELGFLAETTSIVTIQTRQPSICADIQNVDNDIIQDEEITYSEASRESVLDMNPGRRNVTKLIAAATGSALLPQLNLLDQDALEQLSSIMKNPSISIQEPLTASISSPKAIGNWFIAGFPKEMSSLPCRAICKVSYISYTIRPRPQLRSICTQ